MKNNNILIAVLLGAGAYYFFGQKKTGQFYRLPNGELIPVAEAATQLPARGYKLTAYGWIHESILAQLAQSYPQQSGGGNNLNTLVQNLPAIFETAQDIYNYFSENFSDEDLEGNVFV